MHVDWEALRPGQVDAIETIRERLAARKRNTALVLPTRYGKSDIARVSALQLFEDGLVSCSLALSPNIVLMRQLADTSKWKDTLRRYGLTQTPKTQPIVSTLDGPKIRPNVNGEVFLSSTTQLVQNQLQLFSDWVAAEKHRTGLPVAVFVDECHTGSESNKWGHAAEKLAEVGAHVILMTATAERSDGKKIPGFTTDQMSEQEVKLWQSSPSEKPGWVHVKLFEGIKTKLRLRPDTEVRFSEAFTEGVLCKVSRAPFDVELKDDSGNKVGLLSELSPTKSKQELGRIVRRSEAVTEGCHRFTQDLLRRKETQSDAAGMVYCGNDTDRDDPQTNQHANHIKRELQKLAPQLDVIIATSASEQDGSEALQRFADGRHDVVIVKQMAGMGLDVPRVKTGLDLSPVRTFASLVQRMMRPATPYAGVSVCTWITPDDIQSKAIFKRLVTDEGGEASAADLNLILEYEKERDSKPDPPLFAGAAADADFEDTEGNEATADRWTTATALMTALPGLTGVYSHAEIISRLEGYQVSVASDDTTTVTDSATSAAALRADINQLASESISIYRALHNVHFSQYREASQKIYGTAYELAGWPRDTKLHKLDDLQLLERVREAMEKVRTQLYRETGR